jgi:hypothetical protein
MFEEQYRVDHRQARTVTSRSTRLYVDSSLNRKGAVSQSWVKDGRGRQADATAGLLPAPEIAVRSGNYASCEYRNTHSFSLVRQSRVSKSGG